jgi:hypothetical protein
MKNGVEYLGNHHVTEFFDFDDFDISFFGFSSHCLNASLGNGGIESFLFSLSFQCELTCVF